MEFDLFVSFIMCLGSSKAAWVVHRRESDFIKTFFIPLFCLFLACIFLWSVSTVIGVRRLVRLAGQ